MENYKQAKFYLEGFDSIELNGYHNPTNDWNGFAQPYLPIDVLQKMNDQISSAEPDDYGFKFTIEGDHVVYSYYEHNEDCQPIEIDGVKYYSVGLGMCWLLDDENIW